MSDESNSSPAELAKPPAAAAVYISSESWHNLRHTNEVAEEDDDEFHGPVGP
jgi:hypothetical protein